MAEFQAVTAWIFKECRASFVLALGFVLQPARNLRFPREAERWQERLVEGAGCREVGNEEVDMIVEATHESWFSLLQIIGLQSLPKRAVESCARGGADALDESANLMECFDDRALNHDGKRPRITLPFLSCRKASNGSFALACRLCAIPTWTGACGSIWRR